MPPTSVTVTGSLYHPSTGAKLTAGKLYITPEGVIQDGTYLIGRSTVEVSVPSSGNLSFSLVPSDDVDYSVEFDPDPSDTTTPINMKSGYFQTLWSVPTASISYRSMVLEDEPIGFWPLDDTGVAQAEMITNGGFESGVGGWAFDGKTGGTCTVYTSDKYAGAQCAAILNAVDGSGAIALWKDITLTAGNIYEFTVWVRNINCPMVPYFSSAGVAVTTLSGGGNMTAYGTDQWRQFSWVFRANASGTFSPYIRANASVSRGTFLVDGYSVKQILYTATDIVGGRNGTYSGGLYPDVAGALAEGSLCPTFDGTDDYILGASLTGAAWPSSAGASVEAWVWRSATAASEPGIVITNNHGLRFTHYTDGKVWVYNGGGGPYAQYALGTNSAWHYVVATWDGTTSANGLKLYIDGALVSQVTSTIAFATPATTFQIGRNGTAYHSGRIQNVAIYDYPLTSDQIAARYAARLITNVDISTL